MHVGDSVARKNPRPTSQAERCGSLIAHTVIFDSCVPLLSLHQWCIVAHPTHDAHCHTPHTCTLPHLHTLTSKWLTAKGTSRPRMISCGSMNRRREEAMCSSSHTHRHLSAAIHRLRIAYPEEQSACITIVKTLAQALE